LKHEQLQTVWSGFVPLAAKLGGWALKQADVFVSGIADEGGKAIGKKLPYLIVLAAGIWIDHTRASDLIEKLLPHLQ
jgi:hypothetical protein